MFLGSPGAVEGKLGKNRTEADLRRYLDERERLEKEREEVRASLASLKKEKREIREELGSCQGTTASLCIHNDLSLSCVTTAFCCPQIPSSRPCWRPAQGKRRRSVGRPSAEGWRLNSS